MKNTWIHDLEIYPNFFFSGVRDYKNKKDFSFEVSEFKDEREEFYNVFSKYDGYLVGFNSLSYDETIIAFIVKEWKTLKKLPVAEFLQKVKWFNDRYFADDYDVIKYYKWWTRPWTTIDLFMYWSMGLRKSKQLSLKALGIQLHWDEIQELPYSPSTVLTKEQMEDVKRYNMRNDLGITEKLFVKMQPEIALRHYIKTEYKLDCWSMDAPKIAGEILLKDYCAKTGADPKEMKQKVYPEYFGYLGELIEDVKFDFKHPVLRNIYETLLKSNKDFKIRVPFNHGKTSMIISMGIGGIHSLVDDEVFKSEGSKIIKSSDVASLYPTVMLEYACFRQPEVNEKFREARKDRLIAKKNKEKMKDTFLKLVLNSTSGLIDSEYSWLYYSEGALRMRVLGQLIMLKALDEVIQKGYQVLALNTDSIDVIIDKSEEAEYDALIDNYGATYNVIFEHEVVDFTYYSNINAYIQKNVEGKVKRKGLFKYGSDIPLGDSVDEQIIAKALEAYYVNNIDITEYISHPEKYGNHIYDYCLSKKIKKSYSVYHNKQKVQNLNRYYFSKKAPFLYKMKEGKNTFEHVNTDGGVILFNKFVELPWDEYDINYTYYIAKTRKIIENINSKQRQGRLF